MDTDKTPTDERLWDALAEWEAAYLQGRDLPAEELCRDCPELLEQLQDCIRTLKRTAWMAKRAEDGAGQVQAENVSDPTPPTLGEYTLLERIGAGGMGTVFKAVHRRMERVVAVKVLPRVSVESAQRFQQEVKAAGKLFHPNIVTAFDAGEQEGLPYLVMEFVAGADLQQYLAQHGPLPIDRAVSCIQQAAQGLKYAHERGVVHRDVKPSNLLLGQDGTVKILDLGLARFGAAGQEAAMGTPEFMAPEQTLAPELADHRADIYGLGCTLYFLLTGKPPFTGATVIQNVVAHREAPVPSLKSALAGVPSRLESVFQRMAAKSPDARYQSMAEVIAALERLHRRRGFVLGIVALVIVGLGAVVATRLGSTDAVESTQPVPVLSLSTGVRPTTGRGSARTIPTKPAVVNDPSQDRQVAEMVLRRGGKVGVSLNGGMVNVTEVAQLPAVPFRVREINLTAAEVTDADLECVQGLPELSALRLNRTSITDRGLVHLQNLPELWMLEMIEARITDEGLKHLANLPRVSWLTLDSTFVTDAGLPHLQAMPRLRELRLNFLRITDQGLANLEPLTGLRLLEFYDTDVTDAGMKSVAQLKNLTWLMVTKTKVTDVGLAELKKLEGLRNLFVANVKVTEAGLRDFQEARPFCKLHRN